MTKAIGLEVLVEEPSAAEALRVLVPKIRGDLEYLQIHDFQGCRDLLAKLPSRFKGYRNWLPDNYRVVVVIDRDRQDCRALKERIITAAHGAGLRTMARGAVPRQVLVRVACEELEAWFFGDLPALARAFPGVPKDLDKKAGFRDPDAIRNTWEQLERVLQVAGHFKGGLQKIRCAREVAAHMDPENNRSRSFQAFREGLREL